MNKILRLLSSPSSEHNFKCKFAEHLSYMSMFLWLILIKYYICHTCVKLKYCHLMNKILHLLSSPSSEHNFKCKFAEHLSYMSMFLWLILIKYYICHTCVKLKYCHLMNKILHLLSSPSSEHNFKCKFAEHLSYMSMFLWLILIKYYIFYISISLKL